MDVYIHSEIGICQECMGVKSAGEPCKSYNHSMQPPVAQLYLLVVGRQE